MDGILYGLITIGGPILLAAVLIYVMMNNRRHRSPEELARTEAATRELHRQMRGVVQPLRAGDDAARDDQDDDSEAHGII